MANNNPTDMDAFRKYMEDERRVMKSIQKEKEINRLKKNLITWTDSLEWPWNQADLRFFQGEAMVSINEELKHGKLRSFVMMGGTSRGKTFLSYAVVRRFLQMGYVTPSQIRRTTVREGAANINGMFQSRAWKDNFFNNEAKLFLIEGASREQGKMRDKNIERFWREMADFCRITGAKCIITYLTESDESTTGTLPILTVDNQFNLNFLKTMKFVVINDDSRNPNVTLKGR